MKNNIIEQDGEKYTVLILNGKEIRIRHPKGKDLRFMMNSGDNNAQMMFKLASNLTCLSDSELDDMDAKDCANLLKEISNFLL